MDRPSVASRTLNRTEYAWAWFLVQRVPLLSGGLLLALPTVGVSSLPTITRSFYALDGPGEWAMALGMLWVLGLAVALTALVGAQSPPWTLHVRPTRPTRPQRALLLAGLPVLLSLPSLWRMANLSPQALTPATAVASAAELIALLAVAWLLSRRRPRLQQVLGAVVVRLPAPLPAIYTTEKGLLEAGHFSALVFLAGVAALYSLGLSAHPGEPTFPYRVPVLAWLALAQTMFTLVLSGALHLLDHWRLPSFGALFTVAFTSWVVFDLDSSYALLDGPELPSTDVLHREVSEAMDRRLDRAQVAEGAPARRTMVVVTSAGGGIISSAWTVRALLGLPEQLGPGFTDAIGLISGASGGSVATLFYLDAHLYGPAEPDVPRVAANAAAGSLSAIGWSLVYNDVWRMFGVPLAWGHSRSRGWALEQSWARRLYRPGVTLADWRRAVLSSKAPLPVLNASLVETGGALAIGPVPLTDELVGAPLSDLLTLYPGADLSGLTAARLSATFPWVTPNARPEPRREPAYHVADGGYFDNYGVYAALLWLERVLLPRPGSGRPHVERVIWLQLDPFQPMDAQPAALGGLEASVAGPLLTLANARYSTQIYRNERDIERFSALACLGGTEVVRHVVRPLPGEELLSAEQAPLSWTLTQAERTALEHAWEAWADSDRARALSAAWSDPGTRCPRR